MRDLSEAPIAEYIESLGHEVIDFGPENDDRVDYPDYADKVARYVAAGGADRGVLICGTGLGIAMTADKVAGIRATPVQTPQFAQLLANTIMQMSLDCRDDLLMWK